MGRFSFPGAQPQMIHRSATSAENGLPQGYVYEAELEATVGSLPGASEYCCHASGAP